MTSDAGGAPQAADGPSPEEIKEAIAALDLVWGGDGYQFGYDRDLACWWAIRAGELGSVLKAGGPEGLGRLLAERDGAGR
jgi:hypothetical protein